MHCLRCIHHPLRMSEMYPPQMTACRSATPSPEEFVAFPLVHDRQITPAWGRKQAGKWVAQWNTHT
eukprot:1147725-Pelagomonas_calceolata.AAC.1